MSIQIIQMEFKAISEKPVATSGEKSGKNSKELKNTFRKIDEIEIQSATMSANLADLELKLQLLENTSYNGYQLWKIDSVEYRMNQAVTGKVTALHSAPSYQTRGGYKFCSRYACITTKYRFTE